MRRYQQRSPFARILPVLIFFGILVGVGYVWREEIIYFVTGQDILDDLQGDLSDIAQRPTNPPPTPILDQSSGGSGISDAPIQTSPLDGIELAPDGFPVEFRQHVFKYRVQSGDALFLIAQRFGIHPNTIFWANSETLQDNVHLLHVGINLYILPINGVYHLSNGLSDITEIAAQYGITPGDLLYSEYNTLSQYDSSYIPPPGLRLVIPGGRRDYTSWQAPIRTGTDSGESNPEGAIHPGSCRARYSGSGGTGTFINPLNEIPYRVTTGFDPWHPGVDFAADNETPIYAAETGVVVFAGWHRDGYGELIILDHGDGWTTYYGHLGKRFVGCGDQVSKGQYIAGMGQSGNATGIHLHFEMRQEDTPLNPYGYIDIRDVRNPDN